MDLLDETVQIDVNERFLETFGTGTLVGTIGQRGRFGIPKTLVLAFPQASITWCREHNGPPCWVVNEYVIRCLLDDVLKLREWGVDVRLTIMTRDP